MSQARRLAGDVSGPTWISAKRQTAARGRRGRGWETPEGNLSATLLLKPAGQSEAAALRSFVAALAVYEACLTLTGRTEAFALKWPNDVMMNGGKLAGILLESSGQGAALDWLSIGIGVNLAHAPEVGALEGRALEPVALSALGVDITPEDFLLHLACAFAQWETRFTSYGFAPIRLAWLARAAHLGQPIVARTMTCEFEGTFETVNEVGNLVLRTAKGREVIPAADIFF